LSSVNLSGRTILVVDDVRFTRATLVRMLAALGGPTVIEAEDGRVALDHLKALGRRADCVISDLDMPHVDGIDLLQAIRVGTGAIPHTLPVVVLTGHTEFERLGPALLLDLDAFLTKPVSKASLERCLGALLAGPPEAQERRIAPADTYRAIDLSGGIVAADAPESGSTTMAERQVALAQVEDGAVLSRDLVFSNGRLLLPARTRLSARIAQRLNEIAAVSNLAKDVWVAG
jgi:CheY-like chemotaxis protein